MATAVVAYPAGPDFNLDYYLNTHMPLVVKLWGPYGLKGYDIIQFGEGQQYQIQAITKWDSLESVGKAPKDEVFGDVKNFTTAQPVVLSGESKAVFTEAKHAVSKI